MENQLNAVQLDVCQKGGGKKSHWINENTINNKWARADFDS